MTRAGAHRSAPVGDPPAPAAWSVRQVERALRILDRVPGARRLVAELSRVELVDRSLALGAQALLALLPFVVVLAAFAPAELGARLVEQLREAMGLSRAAVAPAARVLTDGGSVAADGGLVGLVVALVSATSFSRALARMYARVFEVRGEGAAGRVARSVVWLPGWLAYMATVALLAAWPSGVPGGVVGPVVLGIPGQVAFWWWSAHYLLLGRIAWAQLLPAALVTTAGATALVACSPLVMPWYARSHVEHFGGFGLVLAAATWLVAFAGMLVAATLVGRLLAEQAAWGRIVASGSRVLRRGGAP